MRGVGSHGASQNQRPSGKREERDGGGKGGEGWRGKGEGRGQRGGRGESGCISEKGEWGGSILGPNMKCRNFSPFVWTTSGLPIMLLFNFSPLLRLSYSCAAISSLFIIVWEGSRGAEEGA